MKHFRHSDRLSGEDEYYLTTLESIVEFIHGLSNQDVKIPEAEYQALVQKAIDDIENEKIQKDEAAKAELTDLLDIGNDNQNDKKTSKNEESKGE